MDKEIGGGLYPDGSPADHARVQQLETEFTAELESERYLAARAVAAWAGQAGLLVDAMQIEEILSRPWKPQAQRGLFALLALLGIGDPELEPES